MGPGSILSGSEKYIRILKKAFEQATGYRE